MSNAYQSYAVPPSAHPTSSFAGGPPPASRNGVAITALVLSIIALLGVVGIVVMWSVSWVFAPLMFDDMSGDYMSQEYTLVGTAPQVVKGQAYPGARLTAEVERVLEDDWSTHRDVACEDTPIVEAEAEASCTGVVDGMDADMTVEFEDDQGHFTLIRTW